MKILRETTEWKVPNHDYAVTDSGKLFAYRREDGIWNLLQGLRTFSTKLRNFETLDDPDLKDLVKFCEQRYGKS